MVPGETPVTTPKLVIVAMPNDDDCQGFTEAGVEGLFNEVYVAPLQTDRFPVIVGKLLTVIVTTFE